MDAEYHKAKKQLIAAVKLAIEDEKHHTNDLWLPIYIKYIQLTNKNINSTTEVTDSCTYNDYILTMKFLTFLGLNLLENRQRQESLNRKSRIRSS